MDIEDHPEFADLTDGAHETSQLFDACYATSLT